MKFVDLFAGCGGLSLGMEHAGGRLVCAVEKSEMAARTFFHNYVGDASDIRWWERYASASLEEQVRSRVVVRPLRDVLDDERVMGELAGADLDVVVGGPPCQGFSMAGRRQKDDIRNRLAWEYLDFVEVTNPKAVVIENVVGMRNSFGPGELSSFEQLRIALSERGSHYVVQPVQVNAMHYGAPQHRPRLMLIALRKDIASELKVEVTEHVWTSSFVGDGEDSPRLAPRPTVFSSGQWTVRDAIEDLGGWGEPARESKNREYIHRLRDLASSVRAKPLTNTVRNHQPRRHTERVVQRFSLYRWMQQSGIDYRMMSLLDRGPAAPEDVARSFLRDVTYPVQLRASADDPGEQFENEEQLIRVITALGTRKHSQKALDANRPARTVVSLPDDYVHPAVSRTFTVRELARFQGFPDSFEFMGKETTGAQRRRVEVPQYTQVGNAVSPWQSLAVATRLKEILNEYEDHVRGLKTTVLPLEQKSLAVIA